MALFNNYMKPGKGIKKEEKRQKKRFFMFFDILFPKLGKLICLNLIYILFCLPIVTIGPATAAMMKLNRDMIYQRPVFLFSDFVDEFKANFKQGFIVGIIDIAVYAVLICAFLFYYAQTHTNGWFWILLVVVILIFIIFSAMNFYIYLMMSAVELKVSTLFKNSFMMVGVGARSNIITFIFVTAIILVSLWYIPITVPIFLFIEFSLCGFIVAFNSFQYIYEFMMKPYYIAQNIPDPFIPSEDEEETVFTDAT